MPTPCYISIEGKTQGNITVGAFTAESVGNIDYIANKQMASQGIAIPLGMRMLMDSILLRD